MATKDAASVARRLSKAAEEASRLSSRPSDRQGQGDPEDFGFQSRQPNRFADQLMHEGALPSLLLALEHSDAEIRADAADALGSLRDVKAVTALKKRLLDDSGEVRTRAAVALIRIGDDTLFPEVVKALRHSNARVVIGAAVVLGHLADSRVVPNLIAAFKTEDPQVGAAVAWALGQCGDTSALPWLLAALEQGFATANVCEALGWLKDLRARPLLQKALAYPSEDTRAYAARALGMLTDENPTPVSTLMALRELLQDEARKVRLCAAIALHELGDTSASLPS